jgi:hypothetical protein
MGGEHAGGAIERFERPGATALHAVDRLREQRIARFRRQEALQLRRRAEHPHPAIARTRGEHGLQIRQRVALEDDVGDQLVVGHRPPAHVVALVGDEGVLPLAEEPLLLGEVSFIVVEPVVVVLGRQLAEAAPEREHLLDHGHVGLAGMMAGEGHAFGDVQVLGRDFLRAVGQAHGKSPS